jgi:hypothetical protein
MAVGWRQAIIVKMAPVGDDETRWEEEDLRGRMIGTTRDRVDLSSRLKAWRWNHDGSA